MDYGHFECQVETRFRGKRRAPNAVAGFLSGQDCFVLSDGRARAWGFDKRRQALNS